MFSFGSFGIFFGLVSALAWGTGDFCGGLATKRSPGYSVLLMVQFVGAGIMLTLALLTREIAPVGSDLLFAIAAGLAGLVGLGALYQGLAMGQMGVIAPLSAVVGATVPLVVGLATEGLPGVMQLLGFGMALPAVWLLAGTGEFRPSRRDLALAVTAGVGFGFYFVLLAYATTTTLFWNLGVSKLVAGSVLALILLIGRRSLLPARYAWGLILLAGLGDAGGNLFFALAAQAGRLDVAAVLSSLYPGMTVLLARVVLHERLSLPQWGGVAAALAAVALIAL